MLTTLPNTFYPPHFMIQAAIRYAKKPTTTSLITANIAARVQNPTSHIIIVSKISTIVSVPR